MNNLTAYERWITNLKSTPKTMIGIAYSRIGLSDLLGWSLSEGFTYQASRDVFICSPLNGREIQAEITQEALKQVLGIYGEAWITGITKEADLDRYVVYVRISGPSNLIGMDFLCVAEGSTIATTHNHKGD